MVSTIGKVAESAQITLFLTVFFVLGTGISLTNSFSTRTTTCRKNTIEMRNLSLPAGRSFQEESFQLDDINPDSSTTSIDRDVIMPARRDLLQQSSLLAGAAIVSATAAAWSTAPAVAQASTDVDNVEGFQVFKTDSGLKYIELEEGNIGDSSKTPQYGQLCVISYTGYLQLPKDNKKTKFASQTGFVLKHGNGKLIAGLDEGLHTMKRGGRRRLIIPPKLGFIAGGLGPVPEMPWQRSTLNSLLTKMVEQQGGNLIYDIELERFFDDEADQGYYQDDEISPEEFAELNRRIDRKNTSSGGALDAVGDDIDITDRDRDRPIV